MYTIELAIVDAWKMVFPGGLTYGYLSRASDMMARERRHCACTSRSLSVGTSTSRNAVMRAWRSAQRVRRGVQSPLLRGFPGTGAWAEGEVPVSVISRLVMSKPNPSSCAVEYE